MTKSLNKWNKKNSNAKKRNYSFDTVSGIKNEALYFPEKEDQKFLNDILSILKI